MRGDRTRTLRFIPPIIVLGLLAWNPRAAAGPGTYDPATRTFNLTYTYAVVPSSGMMGSQLEQLGQVKPATQDQDAKIRAYFAAVSDKLWQATGQRGKIGALNCVDNVKQADIIVSPTGKIGRGGYATPGGFEDRQGHLVISYEDLTVSGKDIDAQLTVFHELCHYLFALPDEYRDGEQAGLCPIQNGSGPGCLMDNYWFDGPRHGWYGRFCDGDHNAQAPLPGTVISGQTAQQTCQQLIDLFFQSHLKGAAAANPPPDAGASAGGGGAGASGTGRGVQPTPDDPFTGIFDSLVDATGSFLRDLIQDNKDTGKTVPSAGSLRSQAEKFLRNQVAFGRQTANMLSPTPDQIKRGVEMAVQTALTSRLSSPQRFSKPFVDQLTQKAKEIAAKELGKPGNASLKVSPLTSSAAVQTRATNTLQRRIESELMTFARGALGLTDRNLSSDQRSFTTDEKAFVKQVATATATQATSEDNSPLGKYLAAARIHIQISQIIARTSLDTRDEMGLPGTDIIRNLLSDADRDLVKLALPGNPFRGFGLRRTVMFAPMPLKHENDHLWLQASPSFTYTIVRKLAVNQISSLIGREKIVVLPEDKPPPIAEEEAKSTDPAVRLGLVRQQISHLSDQVRRNRYDNIIVVVPPGGLPEDLGDEFESLRKRMALNPDVRLDIVAIDTGNIPQRLRDLCARSRGSFLLTFDIDGFGAVGQRLRGEDISGSWVIIPEQGHLDLTPSSQKAGDAAAAPLDPNAAPRPLPLRFRRDRLFLFNNLPGAGDSRKIGPNPDGGTVQTAVADRLQGIDDPQKKSLIATLEDYRNAMQDEQGPKAKIGIGTVYVDMYNVRFFRKLQDNPSTREELAKTLEAKGGPILRLMPSLATLQDDLEAMGNKSNTASAQADFTRTVMPSIDHLKTLRADLDQVDDALKTLNVKDSRSLKLALDRTIQARRGLADLPRGGPGTSINSEDTLYRSKALRQAIERAILVRLQRFSDSESAYINLSKEIAQDPTRLGELPDAEKQYQAYVELSQTFTQHFRNLHKYDAIQAVDSPKADDPFATLAKRLDETPANNQQAGQAQPGAAAQHQGAVAQQQGAVAQQQGAVAQQQGAAAQQQGAAAQQQGAAAPPHAVAAGPMPAPGGPQVDGQEVKPTAKSDLYLQLLAEIYLDLFDLQNELGRSNLVTPTYARLPRKVVPPIVQMLQQPGGQGGQGGQGNQGGKSLVEQLVGETPMLAQVAPFDLKPFTAEEKASFDLIVGFTRAMKFTVNSDDPPVMKLFDKAGTDANEKGSPFLLLDPAKSTDGMLVFRLPYPNRDAGRITSGNYYPKLYLKAKHLPDRGGVVDYTFSVASANPKVVLSATLRQIAIRSDDGDEENDDEVAARGIIPRSKSVAIVEAMVTAGSPVQNVDVTGIYQKIEVNGGPVTSPTIAFLDDGVWPDTTKGDGVYTTKITLDPQERRKQADYRVLIEARSNDKTSYVPTETLKKPDPPADTGITSKAKKAKAPAPPVDVGTPPAPPKFQRATSVNFLVEGMEGTS